MNIGLCVAWFVFGFFVGILTICAIAVIINDMKEEEIKRNGKTEEKI